MDEKFAFEDVDLICQDCNEAFLWSARAQKLCSEGQHQPPRRCRTCRDMRCEMNSRVSAWRSSVNSQSSHVNVGAGSADGAIPFATDGQASRRVSITDGSNQSTSQG